MVTSVEQKSSSFSSARVKVSPSPIEPLHMDSNYKKITNVVILEERYFKMYKIRTYVGQFSPFIFVSSKKKWNRNCNFVKIW